MHCETKTFIHKYPYPSLLRRNIHASACKVMALLLLNHVIHPFRHSNPQRQETDPFRATTRSCTGHNISPIILRRSANYHPNIWDYESLQSLSSEYTADRYFRRTRELKNNVRNLFNAEDKGTMQLLELVDTLQRLGIAYLFENEIKACLDTVAAKNKISITGGDLHATALYFRLLRQHGHQISQDIFIGFKDGSSNFCVSLSDDIKGLLSLYEASHLAVPGEMILSEAKAFAKSHLQNLISPIAPDYAKQISHSLELPLHWRVLRLEARWYIEEIMTGNHDTCPDQLELATLDFNIVQATHQNDLKEMARWWMDLGLGSHNQLSFTRDRLMENFLWTIGVNFYPQYSYCRRSLTKLNTLITTIDDVYDVYGSLEELELFTDAVESRWDVNNIAQLPYYMKICFLALYNTVNEFAYVTLKEQGFDVTYYLKKPWADLCKSYLVEAKWYYNKYTPKLEEYLSNAWISISGPVILVHAYFLLKQEINRDILSSLEEYSPNIIRWSAIILRLSNDLTTSTAETERGDVPKSIQCYMHETRCSEETAREHIRRLIDETWMKMNKDRATASIVSETFLETAVNLARMAQCMYQHGDGHGVSDQETKAKAIALLVEPITPKHDLQD